MQRDSFSLHRNDGRSGVPRTRTRPAVLGAATGIGLILLFVFLAAVPVPAAGQVPGPVKTGPAAPIASAGPDSGIPAGLSGNSGGRSLSPVVGANPTPVPAREVRIPAAQPGIVQRLIERRLTNAELRTVFFILLAVCALGIILFFVIRSRAGKTGGKSRKERPAGPAGAAPVPEDRSRATVVDTPAAPQEGPAPPGYAESPVRFPPSLERKFTGAEFIGEGGLARVFRAENAKTGMQVAVKVPVKFDETTGTHFSRDIMLWQGLVHKNIIRMYSSNILPIPYIEMEYAPSSLAAVKFPVSEEKALDIIAGVAHGLAYAHGLGIVHRDIKPENILIASDGTPKITDWGLGKAIGDPRQSVIISFSPAYAAPEQLDPQQFGRPGPQTDIYQLGVLLFEMLTGTVPFAQEGFSDMNRAILSEEPSIPSWDGKRLGQIRAVIARCLAKRPEDRFGSVAGFLAALGLPENSE